VDASVLNNPIDFNPAILIPVYNHEEAIGPTLKDALQYGYPVMLVDDGCRPVCRDLLIQLSNQHSEEVILLQLPENSGKGAAVKAGFKTLLAAGYSHALQVDADGQHNLADLPTFLETSQTNPTTLVTGYPQYDESVPAIRYYSRYLTHVWVWINTLSFEIKDTMCGFRSYPLTAVVDLLESEPCGNRMDFDTEVIVRWHWRGGRIENIPTEVRYPLDGVSHFNIWHDNLLISLMHTRLFFGMLLRLPKILWRRLNG
jgi:glycosyltransferase involved in cell wall biosynthesis